MNQDPYLRSRGQMSRSTRVCTLVSASPLVVNRILLSLSGLLRKF